MKQLKTTILVGLMLTALLALSPTAAASHQCAHVDPQGNIFVYAGNCAAQIAGATLELVGAALVFADRMCHLLLDRHCHID